MKKAAVLFLCVFLLFSGSAFAEAIDLSSLSDNELLELYNEADKLLTERGGFRGRKNYGWKIYRRGRHKGGSIQAEVYRCDGFE
jgi:hypothetical protein